MGIFMGGQFGVLLPLFIFPLASCAKGVRGNARAERRGRGGMGDRDVKKEGGSVEKEAQIGPFSILSPSFRNGLEARLAQERNKELEEDGVAGSSRPPPKMPAG